MCDSLAPLPPSLHPSYPPPSASPPPSAHSTATTTP
jgi:hypothetical protein